jgi:hypothetical protein
VCLAFAGCHRALPNAEVAPASGVFGRVVDGRGPVAGARVRFKGHTQAVLTDQDGRFQLSLVTGPDRVTACKEGYFIAGAPAHTSPLTLDLKPLPAEDHEGYDWVEPAPDPDRAHHCGNCHGEIYREWSAGGHARSATNRRFRNLFDGSDWKGRPNVGWNLLADNAHGSGVCTACHGPTVPFTSDVYFDMRLAGGVAARGVHCDYCHKIADVGDGEIGLTHGRFNLKLLRPSEGQVFFGPLEDVDRGDDAFSSLYRQSRYCASCHEGTVFGVPVYTTYSEWLTSPARREGKQCQTCHMAPTGKLTNIAPGKGGIERDPHTLANHLFFAGSQADMLRRALYVALVARPGGGGFRADVEVRAEEVGHWVPTGFVDRNLVLVVEALAKDGRPLGRWDGPRLPAAAGKGYAGRPGKLYAKLLRDADGKGPVPFWRDVPEAVDTRLVPGQPDRLHFTFVPGADRIRLRLLHRRFWPEVAATKGWPDNELTVLDQTVPLVPDRETCWPGERGASAP